MTDKLFENLKELRKIQPDQEYSRRSKALIVYAKREKAENWLSNFSDLFYGAKFKMVASISIILIFILAGGFYFLNKTGEKDLVAKAGEINSSIQVNLYGIKYLLENQPDVNPLMVPNMQSLLEKATKDLMEASELSKNPDKMKEALKKIESAQKTFQELNSFFE
jgi:hypothetical protein